MHHNFVLRAFLALCLSLGIATGDLLAQQQQFSNFERERARTMLRDAHEYVKKNYYDPKLHGLDWDTRYQQFDEKIKNATSLSHAFAAIAGFLEALNDSHTYFRPPARPFRVDYGYRMQILGDAAFVTGVRPGSDAESKLHIGDQVVGFNEYEVNRGDFQTLNYYFHTLSPRSSVKFALRDPNGAEREAVVEASTRQLKKVMDLTAAGNFFDLWQLIREEENAEHLVRQRYVEMGDVMIWKMPEFFLTDEEVDHLFGIAGKHKALILDLRGNPGGAVTTLERMIGNVFDHDVKIADRIGRKEMKPQLAKSRGSKGFGGRMIVLIDSDSASAAELFARVIQLEHRGTVIGDRSSGSVMEAKGYSCSQGVDTKIFYSFSITDADLIMADGKSLEHVGVTPDQISLPTAQDLATGRDPVLVLAAHLGGINLEPAAAGKLFPFEWAPF